jgi:NADPH-dependent ferric siderophore reductase
MPNGTRRREDVTAWRFFPVEVRAVRRLSPTFLRVTFTGDGLDRFADNGYDQRIKFFLPLPGHGLEHLPRSEDWYTEWCALPGERRNPMRTYTVRAVRHPVSEVDIDISLHGATGPASAWAAQARPGSTACLMGPNADHDGIHGGIDFRPHDDADFVLLGGDETAVPAIAAILERMPAGARGEAYLEVPEPSDRLELARPLGVQVTWLAREGKPHGERLIPAVREATGRLFPKAVKAQEQDLQDIDVDIDDLWEVPEPAADAGRFYAWLAGEAAMIRTLRRHLVAECGIDRRAVAFMGYWRQGRAENVG